MEWFYVVDFYESYEGEIVFESDNFGECAEFAKQYREDNDGECALRILERP